MFSGKKGNYSETDFRDADGVHGRSKALGEIINDKDLTIRTSIIGPELKENGEGLFHWFMHQHGCANGFQTAIWGGVTTLELAKAIDVAIDQGVTGLIQLSNGLGISKYDLLHLFSRIWHKQDVEILPFDGHGIQVDSQSPQDLVMLYPDMKRCFGNNMIGCRINRTNNTQLYIYESCYWFPNTSGQRHFVLMIWRKSLYYGLTK